MDGIGTLVLISIVMFAVLGAITVLAHIYNLNNIKAKTVGDGQHGTARWARKEEIRKTDVETDRSDDAGQDGPERGGGRTD